MWLFLQMLVLVGQDILGPLFFLPATWRDHEQRWDWHPAPDALYALLRASGDVEAAALDDPRDMPLGDCPVCLSPNSWEFDASDDEQAHLLHAASSGWSRWQPWATKYTPRSNVMVTPVCRLLTQCHHIFHTACLEAVGILGMH